MKKIEPYIDAARNFNKVIRGGLVSSPSLNFNSSSKNNSNLKVVEKPKIDDDTDRGFTEYTFNDGVIVRHSWHGNTYFGHKDYDHSIEVIDDAGYEFEKKTLFYNMQKSKEL